MTHYHVITASAGCLPDGDPFTTSDLLSAREAFMDEIVSVLDDAVEAGDVTPDEATETEAEYRAFAPADLKRHGAIFQHPGEHNLYQTELVPCQETDCAIEA